MEKLNSQTRFLIDSFQLLNTPGVYGYHHSCFERLQKKRS